MAESIVVICPDTNFKLWATRTKEAAIGGGKSAILQLAAAWARRGHAVTIAGRSVVEGESGGVRVLHMSHAAGHFDIAVYVTGSLGHFNDPAINEITASARLFWINGPARVSLPEGPLPDRFIAPARFLARRSIDEWGFPPERVIYIAGESASRSAGLKADQERDEFAFIYASHPAKGLDNAVEVIERVRGDYPAVRLDVYGSGKLHGDDRDTSLRADYPECVRIKGAVAQETVEEAMPRYGAMLYLASFVDGFSLATAEAFAGGVIVIAAAHGSQAEFVRHGWNGFLVRSNERLEPDLAEAERLLRCYLSNPAAFRDMRERARASVHSWDEQAAEWERAWRSL